MNNPHHCESQYLHTILDQYRLRLAVKTSIKIINKKIGIDNFDAFAYCGMSGAGIATILGYHFKKPLVMVRKKDNSHSTLSVEGAISASRIVIIDDLIDSGRTILHIVNTLQSVNINVEIVSVILYNSSNIYKLNDTTINLDKKFKHIFRSPRPIKNLKAMNNTKFHTFYIQYNSDKNKFLVKYK